MLPQEWVPPFRCLFVVADQAKSQVCFAESPARIEDVAGTRARPQDSPTSPHLAHDGDINKDVFPPCSVATGEGALEPLGCPLQSMKELVEPRARVCGWQRQAQQKTARHSAHCGDVAHCPGQALPTHGVGRMSIAKKMRAFQEPITRQNLLIPTGPSEDGRVVTDSQSHSRVASGGPNSDSFDPFQNGTLSALLAADQYMLC